MTRITYNGAAMQVSYFRVLLFLFTCYSFAQTTTPPLVNPGTGAEESAAFFDPENPLGMNAPFDQSALPNDSTRLHPLIIHFDNDARSRIYIYEPNGRTDTVYNMVDNQIYSREVFTYDNHGFLSEIRVARKVNYSFGWELRYIYNYRYDIRGNLLGYSAYQTDGFGGFSLLGEYEYAYDALDRCIYSESTSRWRWESSMDRDWYTYDTNGNLTVHTSGNYVYEEGIETELYKQRIKNWYDANSRVLISYTQIASGADWVNARLSLTNYNDEQRTSETLHQYWNNGLLIDSARVNFTHDANGFLASEVYERKAGTEWVNVYKKTYRSDERGNQLFYDHQKWETGSWVNVIRILRGFDADDHLISQLNEKWQDAQWSNDSMLEYQYDENGDGTGANSYTWSNNAWIPGEAKVTLYYNNDEDYVTFTCSSILVEYELYTGTETTAPLPVRYSLSQNYPNPFNPVTTIAYSLPEAGDVSLIVYGVAGDEISLLVQSFQSAGRHEVQFDAAGLPSGIYFYRLTAPGYSETKKMVLLK